LGYWGKLEWLVTCMSEVMNGYIRGVEWNSGVEWWSGMVDGNYISVITWEGQY